MSLITTPGAADANSWITLAEADAYFSLHANAAAWTSATTTTKEAALVMAARQLSSLSFVGQKRFTTEDDLHEQALAFPRTERLGPGLEPVGEEELTSTVDSATTTTLVDSALDEQLRWQDGYWTGGSVFILQGTGEAQLRDVVGFTRSTTTLTISPAWTIVPDSTSVYLLLPPIDSRIKHAQAEHALWLLRRMNAPAESIHAGLVGMSDGAVAERYVQQPAPPSRLFSPMALAFLKPWRAVGRELLRAG